MLLLLSTVVPRVSYLLRTVPGCEAACRYWDSRLASALLRILGQANGLPTLALLTAMLPRAFGGFGLTSAERTRDAAFFGSIVLAGHEGLFERVPELGFLLRDAFDPMFDTAVASAGGLAETADAAATAAEVASLPSVSPAPSAHSPARPESSPPRPPTAVLPQFDGPPVAADAAQVAAGVDERQGGEEDSADAAGEGGATTVGAETTVGMEDGADDDEEMGSASESGADEGGDTGAGMGDGSRAEADGGGDDGEGGEERRDGRGEAGTHPPSSSTTGITSMQHNQLNVHDPADDDSRGRGGPPAPPPPRARSAVAAADARLPRRASRLPTLLPDVIAVLPPPHDASDGGFGNRTFEYAAAFWFAVLRPLEEVHAKEQAAHARAAAKRQAERRPNSKRRDKRAARLEPPWTPLTSAEGLIGELQSSGKTAFAFPAKSQQTICGALNRVYSRSLRASSSMERRAWLLSAQDKGAMSWLGAVPMGWKKRNGQYTPESCTFGSVQFQWACMMALGCRPLALNFARERSVRGRCSCARHHQITGRLDGLAECNSSIMVKARNEAHECVNSVVIAMLRSIGFRTSNVSLSTSESALARTFFEQYNMQPDAIATIGGGRSLMIDVTITDESGATHLKERRSASRRGAAAEHAGAKKKKEAQAVADFGCSFAALAFERGGACSRECHRFFRRYAKLAVDFGRATSRSMFLSMWRTRYRVAIMRELADGARKLAMQLVATGTAHRPTDAAIVRDLANRRAAEAACARLVAATRRRIALERGEAAEDPLGSRVLASDVRAALVRGGAVLAPVMEDSAPEGMDAEARAFVIARTVLWQRAGESGRLQVGRTASEAVAAVAALEAMDGAVALARRRHHERLVDRGARFLAGGPAGGSMRRATVRRSMEGFRRALVPSGIDELQGRGRGLPTRSATI